jgi:hypothetical protein
MSSEVVLRSAFYVKLERIQNRDSLSRNRAARPASVVRRPSTEVVLFSFVPLLLYGHQKVMQQTHRSLISFLLPGDERGPAASANMRIRRKRLFNA